MAKVVKATVKKARLRKTGRYQEWEVRAILDDGDWWYVDNFSTLKKAEKYIRVDSQYLAYVIIHIDIPPTEY